MYNQLDVIYIRQYISLNSRTRNVGIYLRDIVLHLPLRINASRISILHYSKLIVSCNSSSVGKGVKNYRARSNYRQKFFFSFTNKLWYNFTQACCTNSNNYQRKEQKEANLRLDHSRLSFTSIAPLY